MLIKDINIILDDEAYLNYLKKLNKEQLQIEIEVIKSLLLNMENKIENNEISKLIYEQMYEYFNKKIELIKWVCKEKNYFIDI